MKKALENIISTRVLVEASKDLGILVAATAAGSAVGIGLNTLAVYALVDPEYVNEALPVLNKFWAVFGGGFGLLAGAGIVHYRHFGKYTRH